MSAPALRQQPGACPTRLERAEMMDRTVEAKFWAKVDRNGPVPDNRPDLGPCWVWTSTLYTANGYGQFRHERRKQRAHRLAYELVVGPIPDGLVLDHLCRVRHCVNPDHLEPVTQRENLLRGDTIIARAAAKTHCPQGHEYIPENMYPVSATKPIRKCRICAAARTRRNRAKQQESAKDGTP